MSKKDDRNERQRKKAERKRRKQESLRSSGSPKHSQHTTTTTQRVGVLNRMIRFGSIHAKALLVWSAVAGSILGGYVVLRPDITIEPDFLLNDKEPLSAYFRIQNKGYFQIYDIDFSCHFTAGPFKNANLTGGEGQRSELLLNPGASATKRCSVQGLVLSGPATLRFSAAFRPSFWPWRCSKGENFSAVRDYQGILHWTHQP